MPDQRNDFVLYSPMFEPGEITSVIMDNYSKPLSISPLNSDRDQNFLGVDETGNKYVVKISNSLEEKEFLELQHIMFDKLRNDLSEYVCPSVFENNSAETITILKKENRTYFLRLLNYLPGIFISGMDKVDNELLENVGRFYAKVDRSFLNINHHAAHRYFIWDLKNTADLKNYLEVIPDLEKRKLAKHFINLFELNVRPHFPGLRTGLIHNDGNDNNILINGDGISIIDFGDAVQTFIITELAVVIAYLVLNNEQPLRAAERILHGYNSVLKLTELEADLLYYFICARLTVSVCMSARQSRLNPENEYLMISEKPAWHMLEKFAGIEPEYSADRFRKICGFKPGRSQSNNEILLSKRRQKLGKSLSLSYKNPLKIVKGFGQYLYNEKGESFLDCINNVCHVGHCHPDVVLAAQKQISVLNTNTRYLHENIIEYSEKLTAAFPEPLNVCFFVNSGSEANELALRLARTFTGNENFIVLDHAYHGNTNAVIDISPYKCEGPGGKGLPANVRKVRIPDCYRGEYKYNDKDAGRKYASDIGKIISSDEFAGQGIAGFIAESALSVAGQIFLPDDYLLETYNYIHNAGGLCIADEVQVGFGRFGSHMWAFEEQCVVPDIVTLGKPIGNGHPLGAVVTTKKIADAFNNGMEYFNTYGGNPVSCVVGLEVLNVIERERMMAGALQTGSYFVELLKQLQNDHNIIGDVRGKGLFIGIELVRDRNTLEPADEEASQIVERMRNRNILLSTDGPFHNVIKIKPPMVFNKSNVESVVENLNDVLKIIEKSHG